MTVSWEDVAWAEKEHRIKVHIYDEHGRWQRLDEEEVEEGIAAHRDILGPGPGESPYELSLEFDPEKYSSMAGNERLPNGAAYQFCGAPYFKPFDRTSVVGALNCSDPVFLIIRHGELSSTKVVVPENDTLTINLTGLVPNDLSHFTVKISGPISRINECAEANEYLRDVVTFTITGCATGTGKVTLQTRRYALTVAELDITVRDLTGTLRLAPGQPTTIRYGETFSLVASDLSHDTSEYKLRLYHPFAPEDADCDTHFQNATSYLDLIFKDVPLPGENITVRGCGTGWNRIQLLSASGDSLSRTVLLGVGSSPRNLVAEATEYLIRLTWTPSPDPALTSQVVQRDDGRQFGVGSTSSDAEDTKLTSNTTYTCHVIAVRHDGYAQSSNTSTVTFRPSAEPTPVNTPVPPEPQPTRPPATPIPHTPILQPTQPPPMPTATATATATAMAHGDSNAYSRPSAAANHHWYKQIEYYPDRQLRPADGRTLK